MRYIPETTPIAARFLLASILLLVTACAQLVRPGYSTELVALKPGSYTIDPAHTAVLFKIDHFGLSKYVGRFNSVDASLDFDPTDIENTRLQAIVNTSSIDVGDAEFSKTLSGADWFSSAEYPQAVLSADSVKFAEGGEVVFQGTLTMLGVSQPVDVSVHFNGGAENRLTGYYTIGFSASMVIRRSDFGIDKHIGLVGDEVELEIHAEFQKR